MKLDDEGRAAAKGKREDTQAPVHVLNLQVADAEQEDQRPGTRLLRLSGTLWGKPTEFIIDTGAALEGVVSSRLVPSGVVPEKAEARLLRVGDRRSVWKDGVVNVMLSFGKK